jgi:hypothetical protein
MEKTTSAESLLDINNLTQQEQSLTPEPKFEFTTLYPKISGKVQELIRNYKFRNGYLDAITKRHIPGPPEDPILELVGTVKLHGTHADLVIYSNNEIRLQSRNRLSLDVEHDNYNVAKELLPKREEVLQLRDQIIFRWKKENPESNIKQDTPVIIAGEWIGPGVQKSVAIEKLPAKIFVILSISVNDVWLPVEPYQDICDEDAGIYNVVRGGLYYATLDINDFSPCVERMNSFTLEVEQECPFAKTFSISGIGEGIVWRPTREDLLGDARFWLKTKGALHCVTTTNKLPKNTLDMGPREKAREFAEAAVTEMRLQQAWDYLGEMAIVKDRSAIPKFTSWLYKDVEVEENLDIELRGVDRQALKKAIVSIGKNWYSIKLGIL